VCPMSSVESAVSPARLPIPAVPQQKDTPQAGVFLLLEPDFRSVRYCLEGINKSLRDSLQPRQVHPTRPGNLSGPKARHWTISIVSLVAAA